MKKLNLKTALLGLTTLLVAALVEIWTGGMVSQVMAAFVSIGSKCAVIYLVIKAMIENSEHNAYPWLVLAVQAIVIVLFLAMCTNL